VISKNFVTTPKKKKNYCKVQIRRLMIYALEILDISRQNAKHSRAVTTQCDSSFK